MALCKSGKWLLSNRKGGLGRGEGVGTSLVERWAGRSAWEGQPRSSQVSGHWKEACLKEKGCFCDQSSWLVCYHLG